jgi:hypothetical protein
VLDQQDRHAFAAQAAEQLAEGFLLLVAQAGGRLVEQQQAGVGAQRAGNFENALLAQRQAAGLQVQGVTEADPFQLAPRLAEQARLLGAIQAQGSGRARPCCRAGGRRGRRSPVRSSPAAA